MNFALLIGIAVLALCLWDNRPKIEFVDHPDRIADVESEERMEAEARARWEALRDEWRDIAARVLVDPLVDLEERIFEAPEPRWVAV